MGLLPMILAVVVVGARVGWPWGGAAFAVCVIVAGAIGAFSPVRVDYEHPPLRVWLPSTCAAAAVALVPILMF